MSSYPPPPFKHYHWYPSSNRLSSSSDPYQWPTTVNNTLTVPAVWDGYNQGLPDSLANESSNPSLNTHTESTFIPIYNANLRQCTSDQHIQLHSPDSLPLSWEHKAENPGFYVQIDASNSTSSCPLHKGHSPTTTINGPQVSPSSWLRILEPLEEIEDLSPHQPHISATTESKISESHSNWADHESIQPAKPNTCLQCNQHFRSATELARHARESQHAAFKCKCGSTFQGIYDLKRHQNRHQPGTPAHPCLYCSRHRGERGFRRKDHLTQHIRRCHHITSNNSEDEYHQKKKKPSLVCPYPHSGQLSNRGLSSRSASEISNSEGRQNFTTKKKFIQHMRTVHNESPFECTVEDCDRIGSRGYVREGDLRNHHAKAHQPVTELLESKIRTL